MWVFLRLLGSPFMVISECCFSLVEPTPSPQAKDGKPEAFKGRVRLASML